MKKLHNDITQEPAMLKKSLHYTLGVGIGELKRAAAMVNSARHIIITGIGSSWHAGMAVETLFREAGMPAQAIDASELLYFGALNNDTILIVLSRSGQSIEIVKLVEKAKKSGTRIIAITNAPQSVLAKNADVLLPLETRLDHLISITMYSALALTGGLLSAAASGTPLDQLRQDLEQALTDAEARLAIWDDMIATSGWLTPSAPTYFLARGASLATAYETRLLWEEAAKAPASSYTIGGFRHGPQEILMDGIRVGLWVHQSVLRAEDLALVKDMQRNGTKCMLIGVDLPTDAADLVLSVPSILPAWQFLVDCMPAQLAAVRLAALRNQDCDSFRICPYVIDREGGL